MEAEKKLEEYMKEKLQNAESIKVVGIIKQNEQSVATGMNGGIGYTKELKEYVEAAFADYNDINEDTRMQLELINQAIAELQAKDKQAGGKTRNPIGFISYNKEK